jgi:hypothetical protein
MEQAQTPGAAAPGAPGVAGESRPDAARRLRILLYLAGAGALIILLGLFGTIAAVIGLGMIVATTVLSAPAGRGHGWWTILAVGAAVSVFAALVALVASTIGGLLGVLGGILVLVGVTFGVPLAEHDAATAPQQ